MFDAKFKGLGGFGGVVTTDQTAVRVWHVESAPIRWTFKGGRGATRPPISKGTRNFLEGWTFAAHDDGISLEIACCLSTVDPELSLFWIPCRWHCGWQTVPAGFSRFRS